MRGVLRHTQEATLETWWNGSGHFELVYSALRSDALRQDWQVRVEGNRASYSWYEVEKEGGILVTRSLELDRLT